MSNNDNFFDLQRKHEQYVQAADSADALIDAVAHYDAVVHWVDWSDPKHIDPLSRHIFAACGASVHNGDHWTGAVQSLRLTEVTCGVCTAHPKFNIALLAEIDLGNELKLTPMELLKQIEDWMFED